MREATLGLGSSSRRSSQQRHLNVRIRIVGICSVHLITCCTGWFSTKIFHPNVSTTGEICVNTLKKDWKSSYGIGHILLTVKCLLIYPNPESALDEEAGKLLLEDYNSYCERAKLITSVHAKPKVCLLLATHDVHSSPIRYARRNSMCLLQQKQMLLHRSLQHPRPYQSRRHLLH